MDKMDFTRKGIGFLVYFVHKVHKVHGSRSGHGFRLPNSKDDTLAKEKRQGSLKAGLRTRAALWT